MALIDRPPSRVMRAFLRLPTWLYRARLGWLLGNRFLYIVHRGRKTGKLHRTVVEVVHLDQEAPEVVVAAGWGPETQWYRNLETAGAEEVRFGRARWRRPGQRLLSEPERVQALSQYTREHPRAAKELGRVFGLDDLGDESVRSLAERIRAVAFSPS